MTEILRRTLIDLHDDDRKRGRETYVSLIKQMTHISIQCLYYVLLSLVIRTMCSAFEEWGDDKMAALNIKSRFQI